MVHQLTFFDPSTARVKPDVPKSGAYLQILMSAYNFVWLYVLVCFLYGVASCLAREQARLPGVADAADRQVM